MSVNDRAKPNAALYSFKVSEGGIDCSVQVSSQIKLTQQAHFHEHYQIYYVRKGTLTHHVNGQTAKVMRGDCFIIPPLTVHKIEIDPLQAEFSSFSFFEDFIPTHLLGQEMTNRLLAIINTSNLRGRLPLNSKEMLHMEKFMSMAREEFKEAEEGYLAVLQGILAGILIILARAYLRDKSDQHSSVILETLEYVNAHYAENLTVQNVAKRMYLSESTFYRTFKQATGYSFKEYLTVLRIRQACILLRDKSVSITTVALECGYSNYSAFYRSFMQQMQISPHEYRQSV